MPICRTARLLRRLAPLAAVLLTCPTAADITPEARRIVDRHVEATGGKAAFEADRSLYVRSKISALGLTGTHELWTRRPDRRATDTRLGPLSFQEGYDGTVAWRTDPHSGKLVVLDGKDLEDAKASAYFDNDGWLLPDQGGGKVTLAGTDSLGTYDILEVTPPTGRARRFYVNRKTGLIDRSTTRKDQMVLVSTYTAHRPAGGLRMPFETLTQIEGMPANDLSEAVDSVQANAEVPDSRFRPPGPESQQGSRARYLKTPGKARLPFDYAMRHVWLKVSVNGAEPVDFIYDTGASVTVIDSGYAAKIGLKTEGKLQGSGAGSVGSASFSKLESVRVAAADGDGVELDEVRVGVLSINAFLAPFFWRDCAGVLGHDFITQFVNEIDFDRQTLTLHDPKTFQYAGTGAAIPFTLAGTVPAIPMKLDGTYEGQFRVDVGSSSTVDIHGPFARRHDLVKKAGRTLDVMGGGFGGTFHNQLTRMRKIEIGSYAWERPIVSLSSAETGAFASEDYAGNIGNLILDRFKCTLDYERRVLYLEPGIRYSEPDRFSRTGVQLTRHGDTVRAMQVLPKSPAAKAGLREGDEVTAIDGKQALSYKPDELAELFERGAIGRKVVFEVVRAGKREKLGVVLADIL